MSKIKDILHPCIVDADADYAANTSDAFDQGVDRGYANGFSSALNSLTLLDTNLDTLRDVAQALIGDCDNILNRRDGGLQTNGSTWVGMPINAARDIKQRAGVMLRLLDGEEI